MTTHSLRHYFATRFLRLSGDLASTQIIPGHASTDTTRIYAELDVEHLRRGFMPFAHFPPPGRWGNG